MSGGRLDELQDAVELAQTDRRDLLVAAGFADDPQAPNTGSLAPSIQRRERIAGTFGGLEALSARMPSITTSRGLMIAAFLSLTGCEYFSKTTVPSFDSFRPLSVVSLWFDGNHQEMDYGQMELWETVSHEPFYYATTDGRKAFVAVAAAWDVGGVREVRLNYRLRSRCVYGPPRTEVVIPWTTKSVTQAGEIGDLVDDGLWTSHAIRFNDYVSQVTQCGGEAIRLDLEWVTSARDFHNNWSHFGTARLIFFKWPG